jgi:hypothetical protein
METVQTTRVFVHPDGRMDRKNAALYVGCAAKTLADWATKGIGPVYIRVGGRSFYFRSDLDSWIAKQPRHCAAAGRS